MAERGGQSGNKNASKNKPWSMAIERALRKRSKSDQLEALDDLAEKLLTNCDQGDMAALKELGDRLDGKPAQAIVNGDDGPFQVETIKRLVVDPKASDA